MAGLEHSRWLVWHSNIFGLTPIRIEVDAKTRKFQKLYCSWAHPVTWWFILHFIFRVAMEIWIARNSEGVLSEVNTKQSMLTKFTFTLQFVTSTITLLTPLIFLSCHKYLAKAWEYLKRFDSNIESTGKWTCTSKRRIVCGVFLALLVVSQITVQRCNYWMRTFSKLD
jgi:phosphatidylglycerophosphate synthase